ncbi:MAG TPA: YncE family protein [Verrucomicrobiae bacterium]|nr:YncE family protein [Verrucomicrobiae bacterium]
MKQYSWRFLFGILGLLTAAVCRADGPYHFIKEIPVGGEGGWDALTVDSSAQRLYVSHATRVVVIDLANDTVIGEITNTPGVHDIALAPKLNRGFVSDGREAKASLVDLKTLQTISKVDTGPNPDAIIFEPGQNEVYAFNGRGQSATVIAADSGKVVTTIPLGGKPEFAEADPESNRVFDNLEDKSEVAAIDTKTHQVVNRWSIAPGESASGIAVDPKNHRLFMGCDNQLMVMMDSTSGKVLATVPIGEGVDGAAFDSGTQLAFASCGQSAAVTIAHEDGDKLAVVQVLKTERGARTMALDPVTHKIYLPTAKFGPLPESANGERRRPPMIPGSFKILVYGMDQ